MKFSQDTKEILKFLDYTTDKSLFRRHDLAIILEFAATYNEVEALEKILFLGTSLWNSCKVLKRNIHDSEKTEKLREELNPITFELRFELAKLISTNSKRITDRFNQEYLNATSHAFINLTELCHDIAELKDVVSAMKKH